MLFEISFGIKKRLLKKHFSSGIFKWFIKNRKNLTSRGALKFVRMGENSHRIFCYFSLNFLVENVLNFQDGENKCCKKKII